MEWRINIGLFDDILMARIGEFKIMENIVTGRRTLASRINSFLIT